MAIKVGMVSLGCSKNLVDSERMLYKLRSHGYKLVTEPGLADVAIVNTCGFIKSAKEEAIETILELGKLKEDGTLKKIIVTGCLAERYKDEFAEQFPEADAVVGIGNTRDIVDILDRVLADERYVNFAPKLEAELCGERIISTLPFFTYLKIAEGCSNCCTYCAIPLIRGGKVSIPMEKLVKEAQSLADSGVKELTLIAQDTSAYGTDLYGKPMLAELMRRIAKIDKLHWIRVLYSYPNTIDEELVDTMVADPKIVNYIDIPIQHIDPDMLKAMNRHGSAEHIREITDYIRRTAPDFILRTTVITGFPGETEEQFGHLTEFLKEHSFDRLGAFAYSQEDDTPAADMPNQIDEDVKQRRLKRIMSLQQGISLAYNKKRIGTVTEALVEQVSGDIAYGRTYAEAPEVDGTVMFSIKNKGLKPGDFTMIKLTGAGPYDMEGEEI